MKEKQFTSSVFYFKQALSMLTPQSNSRLSLGIKQNLGKVYQEIGRYEQSNMVLFEVLRTEQNFNNFPIVLGLLQDLAFNHVMLGNVAKATKYLTDAKEIHKTLLEAHAYIEDIWRYEYFNALIFYYLKRFEEADKYCEDAIIISEKDDNSLHLMKSLLLMAKILTATFNGSDDDLELIRNFLEETKGLAKKEGRDEILIDAYLQQVQLIKNTSHEREIPDILEKAEKIANQGKSDLHKGKIATQYGIFFHVQREYEKARESFQSAIDYYREAGHLDYLAEANYNISCTSCLLHLGEETLEHLHRAIDLNPKYKSVALNDEDFKSIKKDEAFLSLVED